ncbi:MAG: AmmeMemoRadiSam system radical SAM enzyme [Lachnospiraceae bacterium]|nr:AmmeMemoRadiSam system radical SAM enzyme [Lachnospiraceae bacterium]
MRCNVCFRHCEIEDGKSGFCGVRTLKGGVIRPANYGLVTSLALDPIEKKPLARFKPGSKVLSVGSYGCNLRCPFCQNDEISWSERAYRFADEAEYLSPKELADIAYGLREKGNIGVAFTYNEPLIGYEYVRDTAKFVKEMGMDNVLVTNGCASLEVLSELTPYIDAMNIDLKGFTESYYKDVLGGDLKMVKTFISEAARVCHVEVTTLVVPGFNDSEEEITEIASFIASLDDGEYIPLHISRFFPQFKLTDRPATDVGLIYRLRDVASEKLKYVYTGNC